MAWPETTSPTVAERVRFIGKPFARLWNFAASFSKQSLFFFFFFLAGRYPSNDSRRLRFLRPTGLGEPEAEEGDEGAKEEAEEEGEMGESKMMKAAVCVSAVRAETGRGRQTMA